MSLSYLWDEAGRFCLQWWRSLIVEYGGDEQADLWNALVSVRALSFLLYLALATAVFGAGFILWLLLRRMRLPRTAANVHGDAAIYPHW